MGQAITEITPYSGTISGTTKIPVSDNDTLQAATADDLKAYMGSATAADIAAIVNAASSKTTPVDADAFAGIDSAASFGLKKFTWASIKATLKTYFDTLYQPLAAHLTSWAGIAPAAKQDALVSGTNIKTVNSTSLLGSGDIAVSASIAPLVITDANTVEQYNGSNAQKHYVYNLRTTPSDYERGFMRWNSNVLEIGTEAGGTGVANRKVRLSAYDTIEFWNTQYGYSMGSISAGTWYVNGGVIPQSANSGYLGGNGSNNGNGWAAFAMASGTTATVGDVTMNKSAGRINVGAGATSVIVTNSRVSAASHIFSTITTNDATAQVKNIVPASGSFTINFVAPTSQIEVDFFVVQFGI